ncbi:MAG: DUF1345 domain-containing protein [Myxococcaceae bacterium]
MAAASHAQKRAALRSRAIFRLLAAVTAGVLTGVLVTGNHGWAFRLVAGWDAGLVVLLGLAWSLILRDGPEATRRRAAAVDPGSALVRLVVVVSSTVCLLAATAVVRFAKTLAPRTSEVLVVLALLAVALAWMAVHTAFTFRYAHLYYRTDGQVGGLRFPDDAQPADIDFAYYAFTVGMCFGATDVFLTETRFRRATLGHAILSFFFNTGILAMTLNFILSGLS